MTLSNEEKNALVLYRKEKAYTSLREAEDVAGLGHWNLAANRLYYAAYYMATALLTDRGYNARTHTGVVHLIGLHFTRKGLIDANSGRLLSRLFEMRQSGDYDDMFDFIEEDVQPYFEKTRLLLLELEKLLSIVD